MFRTSRQKSIDSQLRMSASKILRGFAPALEARFRKDHLQESLRHIRWTLGVNSLVTLGFGLILGFGLDNPQGLFRFLLMTLLQVLGLGLTWLALFRRWLYPLMALGTLFSAYGFSHHFSFDIALPGFQGVNWLLLNYDFAGMILVLLAMNVGFQMPFVLALATSLLVGIYYTFISFMSLEIPLSHSDTLLLVGRFFYFGAAMALSLLANFLGEFYRRKSFLLEYGIEQERREARDRACQAWKEAYKLHQDIQQRLGESPEDQNLPDALEYMEEHQLSRGIQHLLESMGYETYEVPHRILDLVLELSGAESGVLLLRPNDQGEATVAAARLNDGSHMDRLRELAMEELHSLVDGISAPIRDRNLAIMGFPIDIQGQRRGAFALAGSEPGFDVEYGEMYQFLVNQLMAYPEQAPGEGTGNQGFKPQWFEQRVKDLGLTGREIEVLRLVLEGRSNREICEQVFIAMNTLRSHLKNIYFKAGVPDRKQLVELFSVGEKPVAGPAS